MSCCVSWQFCGMADMPGTPGQQPDTLCVLQQCVCVCVRMYYRFSPETVGQKSRLSSSDTFTRRHGPTCASLFPWGSSVLPLSLSAPPWPAQPEPVVTSPHPYASLDPMPVHWGSLEIPNTSSVLLPSSDNHRSTARLKSNQNNCVLVPVEKHNLKRPLTTKQQQLAQRWISAVALQIHQVVYCSNMSTSYFSSVPVKLLSSVSQSQLAAS